MNSFSVLVVSGVVLVVSTAVGISGYHEGRKAGVASVPPEDCTSEVQVAEQGAYSAGVAETVKAAQAYILESCTRQKEITVAGETFVCLKKQEM